MSGRRLSVLLARRVTLAVTNSTHYDLPSHASKDEYLVVLVNASRFDRLLRKDDFLDEGVAAVFSFRWTGRTLIPLFSC
jgi:hypothetical protein